MRRRAEHDPPAALAQLHAQVRVLAVGGRQLVIEPAEGKADDIVEALKAYQQDQVAFYGNYAEFATAQANVENSVIASSADRVVMAIASNECAEDLTDAVNDVLLK